MNDDTANICIEIFRKATGMDTSKRGASTSDAAILSSSLSDFDLDSLETMELIMAVEERFDIQLDEEAVNRCEKLSDLVGLVAAELRV
jgi:acyl carrier protein